MTDSRRKGKENENMFANWLRDLFPNIHRNWEEQSAKGGLDLVGCDPFNFEVKSGKKYTLKTVVSALDQVEEEGHPQNYDVVLVNPHYRDPQVWMTFGDFYELLAMLVENDIIKPVEGKRVI